MEDFATKSGISVEEFKRKEDGTSIHNSPHTSANNFSNHNTHNDSSIIEILKDTFQVALDAKNETIKIHELRERDKEKQIEELLLDRGADKMEKEDLKKQIETIKNQLERATKTIETYIKKKNKFRQQKTGLKKRRIKVHSSFPV